MVTRDQIKKALGEEKNAFRILLDTDHDMFALSLLRKRIPYEECKSIIRDTGYDKLFLCDVDVAIEYLSEDDLIFLADCNMFIDSECDCLSLFV